MAEYELIDPEPISAIRIFVNKFSFNPLTGKLDITSPHKEVFDPSVSEYFAEITDEEIEEIVGEISMPEAVLENLRELSDEEIEEIINA